MTSTSVTDITKRVFFVWFTLLLLYWITQISLIVKVMAGQLVGKDIHSRRAKNKKNDQQQCCYRKSKILERETYSICATLLYIFMLQLSISTSHFEDRCFASSQVFMWITPENPKSKLWCTVTWGQQEKPMLRCLQEADVASQVRGVQQSIPAPTQKDQRPPPGFALMHYWLRTAIVSLGQKITLQPFLSPSSSLFSNG